MPNPPGRKVQCLVSRGRRGISLAGLRLEYCCSTFQRFSFSLVDFSLQHLAFSLSEAFLILISTLAAVLLARQLRLKWRHEKEVAALREGNLRLAAELAERQRAEAALRSEAALRAKDQQFSNVFEHAPVGIFYSLPEGRFLEVNPALTRMLGYASPAELVAATSDMTTQIYADPALRPRIVADLLENAGWVHWDAVVWRCKDGRLITVDMTGRKVNTCQFKLS
ncbi:MAG: PAS domain S-box protein [Verrucomicrobiota bacterium]